MTNGDEDIHFFNKIIIHLIQLCGDWVSDPFAEILIEKKHEPLKQIVNAQCLGI